MEPTMELTEANLRCLNPNDIQTEVPETSVWHVTVSARGSWHTESVSDPDLQYLRDPVQRLRRYKFSVVNSIWRLVDQGPEGEAVFLKDELRLSRRDHFDVVMKDGTRATNDINFWKAKLQHFDEQWCRIDAKKQQGKAQQGKAPISNMYGPAADRIMAWIPEPPELTTNERIPNQESVSTQVKRTPSQAPGQVQRPEPQPILRGRKRALHDTAEANVPASKNLKLDCPLQRRRATMNRELRLLSTESTTLKNSRNAAAKASRRGARSIKEAANRQGPKRPPQPQRSPRTTVRDGRKEPELRRSVRIAAQEGRISRDTARIRPG
ncbi:hypothetical protein BHE90_010157 [Fusarium euwallaceae]|uniref:Uncharacterized protein n=2 Tax=Fusarium solani species complex TaxID=232080 RepID=A0A428SWD3_9HYPO|nr:hypothetical protein CEP52_012821 [Fusarium oligoseptatum]RTE75384.1 hypothetical protein BHE90_010157 [Fusarium euwallaceae]